MSKKKSSQFSRYSEREILLYLIATSYYVEGFGYFLDFSDDVLKCNTKWSTRELLFLLDGIGFSEIGLKVEITEADEDFGYSYHINIANMDIIWACMNGVYDE